jgi:hypothetical protein
VGALAEVARILADAKVNVTGLALGRHPDQRNLRILVDDPETAAAVLHRHGLEAHHTAVVTMRVVNRPGELARAAESLARQGINVEAVFVNLRSSKKFELVFQVDDPARARRALDRGSEEE